MLVAIVVGGLIFLLLALWAVQVVLPAPWEQKRRRRHRVGLRRRDQARLDARQDDLDLNSR